MTATARGPANFVERAAAPRPRLEMYRPIAFVRNICTTPRLCARARGRTRSPADVVDFAAVASSDSNRQPPSFRFESRARGPAAAASATLARPLDDPDGAAADDEDGDDELPEEYGPSHDAAEFAAAFVERDDGTSRSSSSINVSLSDAPLAPVPLSALAPSAQYAPPAARFRWLSLSLRGCGTALVPTPVDGSAWTWRAWANQGSLLDLGVMTYMLAPVPPPRPRDVPLPRAPPAALAAVAAMVARARALRSGVSIGNDGVVDGEPAPQPAGEVPSAAAFEVDPQRLPLRVQVRCTRGLFGSPIGEALAGDATAVARFLVDLHAVRTGLAGDVRTNNETRPLAVLDSWEARDSATTRILGVDFESLSTDVEQPRTGAPDPPWGAPSALAAAVAREAGLADALRGLEMKDARATLGGGGGVGAGDNGADNNGDRSNGMESTPAASTTTIRHALTIVVNTKRDVVIEIAVSAPVDAWDALSVGSDEVDHGAWPAPSAFGFGSGVGLRTIVELATIVDADD